MIDPVIFSIGGFSLRWYGVIVMIGAVVGSLMVERVLKRYGENSDTIWDALVVVLPVGIIGARLWYVINATLGGDTRFSNNPIEIVKVWNGGLHIFGAFLFGAVALLLYLNKNKLDPWLFLDAAGPALLVGQGIGRLANFINQELYGPPTTLPWGIPIEALHRLPQYQDLIQYPLETTRFHPTFAYEMLWNFAAAGLLLWLSRRYENELKPGAIFSGWLLLAGLGRTWIEFFRPDQPRIGELDISYSMVISALMAITGAVMLMTRYKVIHSEAGENWDEEYKISDWKTTVPGNNAIEQQMALPAKPLSTKSASSKSTTGKTSVRKSPSKTRTVQKKTTTRTKKTS
jgi:phosphatidylglycerol:prolipoprotein diacylglycerol transferase